MGNVIPWQQAAASSLGSLAIALQPHHGVTFSKDECMVLAIVLQRQVEQHPDLGVESAILANLIKRFELRLDLEPVGQPLCIATTEVC